MVATARVLATKGEGGLTTNAIAQVAGVSIGSVYQYFPDKQALVAALIERKAERDLEELGPVLRVVDGSGGVRGALRRAIEGLVMLHRRDLALMQALLRLVSKVGAYDRVRRIARQGHEAVKALLGSMPSAADEAEIDRTAFLLFHALEHWMHMAVLERPDLLDDPRFVDAIERVLLSLLPA